MGARLKTVRLPEFGMPQDCPELPAGVYRRQLNRLRARLRESALDVLVVYGDREHCANLAWLTGFDPRFEEALLVLPANGDPILFTGLENQGPAKATPLDLDVRLYRPFGLMGQDRAGTPELEAMLSAACIAPGLMIGIAGWKYFGPTEASQPEGWIEIPAFLVDAIRNIAGAKGKVVNAGALFMHPEEGLRASIEIDELARFEFAACHVSEAVKRVTRNTRPGMREFEAAAQMRPIGLPLSCHAMFSSGPRAWLGLPSPTSKVIERGEAVTTAYGVHGALSCRAGWLAEGPEELPEAVRDYVDRLVVPYFEAVADWLEAVGIGVGGATLFELVMRRIGDPFFGVTLNPGHLIHLDEWMHSPIAAGSTARLRSGMALQVDIIPATGGPYFTSNMEDGIALLDDTGRSEFKEKYPDAFARIEARRAFMADGLGIRLKPEVLPFSNLASFLAPFWLSPALAMTRV